MQLTPMMQQYLEIKKQYNDTILFFRIGDFYEMFFEDAITASKVLEITLTGKSCGLEERAPMCGVPHHSADTYIAKLVEKGYKVAICEQIEDPATAKGIVRRDVVRVVTPGTVLNQSMLNEKENNYLSSIYLENRGAGIAFCDLSTGEIGTLEIIGSGFQEKTQNELEKLSSKEILVNLNKTDANIVFEGIHDTFFTNLDVSYYNDQSIEEAIFRQFQVKSLQGLGIAEMTRATKALGALLLYILETQKQQLSHIQTLKISDINSHMSLDKATIRNLELIETIFEKEKHGSLIGILDSTHTSMGSRKLKQWIKEPLTNKEQIQNRLDSVDTLVNDILMRKKLKESLKQIYDLERLSGRVACGNINARDLIALCNSIHVIPNIKAELFQCTDPLLGTLEKGMDELKPIYDQIKKAITDDPPHTIKEGGIIRENYSKELDQLKDSIKGGQTWIADLESIERKRTGIKNLKVGFNKVFGYYIEITKSYYDSIPEEYIRKQTLVNCERFITPELKEVESVVLNAENKINQLEYELFQQVRKDVQKYIVHIQNTSAAISTLDVLLTFAEVSCQLGYTKPIINDSDIISIEKGRHPVLEQINKKGVFVPNDTYLDRKKQSMLLITGPNMSGKSTYMRQTALIVLMAQAGCFVPANKAKIGLVDRIYTRIGASDNLSQGQSTFFVEMSELAYILNTATENSLVILDEIGRGTSTYDGLSIAWSVIEYLCNNKQQIRTLFATHYHELTVTEGNIKGIQNYNIDVKNIDGNIIFLHKIVKGSANQSYGIHVAKLAGVPTEVLEKAQRKLIELETKGPKIKVNNNISFPDSLDNTKEGQQISLFDFREIPALKRLKTLDLMEITPSQAFKILEELKNVTKEQN